MANALRLALDLNHSVYHCTYLALASQNKVRLVTADRRMARRLTEAQAAPLTELAIMTMGQSV
jgi:predicted nucleic acid-binding protein